MLSSQDAGYKQLIEAERSFRDLKGTLLLRPVFHRKDDRIRAHVLICFLALVLVRLAATRRVLSLEGPSNHSNLSILESPTVDCSGIPG